MKHYIKYQGTTYELESTRVAGGIEVRYNGVTYLVEPQSVTPQSVAQPQNQSKQSVQKSAAAGSPSAGPPSGGASLSPSPSPSPATTDTQVVAPMNGVIKVIHVTKGTTVTNQQTLVTMEAMKMEVAIKAPCDGTVQDIMVQEGSTVEAGTAIATVN